MHARHHFIIISGRLPAGDLEEQLTRCPAIE